MTRPFLAASLAAALLVLVRSAPHVLFEGSHFDSDMAIFGIMGLDLARGEPLPFYAYGQQYLLAIEAYLAAPLFAITGASVASLKAPIVALNVATAVLLIRGLRAGRLGWRAAFLSALPFVVASPYMAKCLVAAHGCNIEPFFAIVLLFLVRERPIAFGVIGGVFYLNRELVAYALPALVVADRVEGRRIDRRYVARRLAGFGLMALVVVLGRIVGRHGPHYFGTPAVAIGIEREPVQALAWLFRDILPVATGIADGPAPDFAPGSLAPRLAGALLFAALALSLVFASSGLRGGRWRDETTRKGLAFPVYLVSVAIVASGALVLLGGLPKDVWAVRYGYLALLGASGILGAFFATDMERRRATLVSALVGAGAAATVVLHLVLARDVAARGPTKERVLARWLVAHGHESGRAEYWTAYATSFLSNERVMLTATGARVPIQRYEDRWKGATRSVAIEDGPCAEGATGETVVSWCVTERARSVSR